MAQITDELTPSWLSDTFLLGVDLTLDDGSPYPDEIFRQNIAGAVSWVEHELGIKINPLDVRSERHDAFDANRSAWWPFRLDQRPLMKVNGFRIRYGSYEPVEFPLSWAQVVSNEHGQIHLIPSEDTLGSYMYRVGIPIIMGDVFSPQTYIPGYFEWDYTAGFGYQDESVTITAGDTEATITLDAGFVSAEYDVIISLQTTLTPAPTFTIKSKSDTEITIEMSDVQIVDTDVQVSISALPSDIRTLIGLKAALPILDVAGDLLVGAGIASVSIGTDGLHSSVNTTSSATNSGFGARRLAYEREIKSLLPAIKARYKIMQFGVL